LSKIAITRLTISNVVFKVTSKEAMIQRGGREIMKSRMEIEEILKKELEVADSLYKLARAEFMRVCSDIPSGLPQPDGTQRIQNAGRSQRAAQEAYAAALRRFNGFIVKGELPEELRFTRDQAKPN
jgi:hypothetical protein